MFLPSSLHQHQISHADNNIAIMQYIHRVFIDIIWSQSTVTNDGWSFIWQEKVSQADGLNTIGC